MIDKNDLIFNRTLEDVEKARKIRDEKVKKFKDLSDDEINTLERGFCTINTIRRITQKQEELNNLLADMGYFSDSVNFQPETDWVVSDIFTNPDFNKLMLYNLYLEGMFFVYSDTPSAWDVFFGNNGYGIDTFNALEKLLYDIDVMINDVKSHYRECGNFECGEE